MGHVCQNCTQTIADNYCGQCGQKKYKRIDRKYLIDEVQYLAIHTNKGFFYSLKTILKNPGKTARTFIDGNRVNHYKPLGLTFLLSGISAFIAFKFINFNSILVEYYTEMGIKTENSNNIIAKISNYNSILSMLMIPIFAIFTSIVFRKWGQNYYEHVVMNAFFQCYYTIIYIALYPIIFLLKNNNHVIVILMNVMLLILPFLSVWFYKGFYPDRSLKAISLRVLYVFLMLLLSYILLVLVGIIARGFFLN